MMGTARVSLSPVQSRRSSVLAASACLTLLTALTSACSSSKGGSDAGFGGGDSGQPTDASTKGGDANATTSDAGDAGSTGHDAGPAGDGGCGSNGGSTWCQTYAPAPTSSSNVLCDDFDQGVLSSAFGWTGIARSNFVSTEYVSPYCSVQVGLGDGGASAATTGAFTDHTYLTAPESGTGKLAFDLYVPGGSACEGATVAVFAGYPGSPPKGAIASFVTVSHVTGSGASASSYDVGLIAAAGAFPLTPSGTQQMTPITVTPRASDKGWARIELDVTAYTLAQPPTASTESATVAWYYVNDTKAQATSTAVTTSGSVALSGDVTLTFEVGVLPDATTGNALAGCQLYVDDFVTDYTQK